MLRASHKGSRFRVLLYESAICREETVSESSDSRYEAGMKVRTEVLGAEHVARAQSRMTPLDADFQRWITESAWGGVWTRPDLDRRTRSLVTIAILASLGRHEELELHFRASKNLGVDPKDIAEVLMHVGVYAGVPAANRAFALAKTILDAPADE
jgi:4-carboxymuconolactone decarboxylase